MTLVHSADKVIGSIPTEQAALSVADVLDRAADLIEKPGGWIRGYYGKTPDGDATSKAELATCFCGMGAIAAAAGEPWLDALFSGFETEVAEPALAAFSAHLDGQAITFWNDSPFRRQAEVVAALRAAAEKARTASAVGTSNASEPDTPAVSS